MNEKKGREAEGGGGDKAIGRFTKQLLFAAKQLLPASLGPRRSEKTTRNGGEKREMRRKGVN